MEIAQLEEALSSPEMPMLVGTNGLALKIYEWLLSHCKNQLSESDLEDLIDGKLNSTEENLEQLETMEYPEAVAERHAALHQIFLNYQDSLGELVEHLWGEPDPEISFGEIFRSLLSNDREALASQDALDEQVDDVPALSLTW